MEFGREVGGMNWNQCKMRGKNYLDLKNEKFFFFFQVCVPEDQAANYTTCDGAVGGDAKVCDCHHNHIII